MTAAAAFGLAAVLQAIATRDTSASAGLDPTLLLRLLRRPVFLVALALNVVGFAMHVAALQSLPLYLVQSVIAGYVAVTAVLSTRLVDVRLGRAQWLAVAAVVAGLALLGPTAQSSGTVDAGGGAIAVLLAVVVVAGAAAVPAGRLPGLAGALTLGLLSGVGFGVVAVSARLLPDLSPLDVVRAPEAYVLVLAGLVAFLLYSTAMQRGSVTTTTAAVVVTQTGLPALVGALLLGDRVRSGLLPVAVAGFALALAGAVGLARFEAVPTAVPANDG